MIKVIDVGRVTDVHATFSRSLAEEMDYRLDLMEQSALDEGEEFKRDDAAVYLAISDMERSDAGLGKWKRELLRWQIERGVYVEMSEDEIRRTQVTRGKPWAFVLDGKKYRFERGL